MAVPFTPSEHNALTLNSIGLGGTAFPAWAEVTTTGSVTSLHFGAIQLQDFADLVFNHDAVFVYDVGHYSLIDEPDGTLVMRTLKAVGEEHGITTLGGEDDEVLWSGADLQHFAREQYQYQLSALGVTDPNVDLADLWVRATSTNWADGDKILASTPEADVYVDIHDNCYAYVEVRDAELVNDLVARLLWLATATAAFRAGLPAPPLPPGHDVVDACLGPNNMFFAGMGKHTSTDDTVVVPYSHSKAKVFDAKPPPTHRLQFHADSGWAVTADG